MITKAHRKFWGRMSLSLAMLLVVLLVLFRSVGEEKQTLMRLGILLVGLGLAGLPAVCFLLEIGRLQKKLKQLPMGRAEELERAFVLAERVGDCYFSETHLLIHQCTGTMAFCFDLLEYTEIGQVSFLQEHGGQLLLLQIGRKNRKVRMSPPLPAAKQTEFRKRIAHFAAGHGRIGVVDDQLQKERQTVHRARRWRYLSQSAIGGLVITFVLFFLYAGGLLLLNWLSEWMKNLDVSEVAGAFWPNLLLIVWSAVMLPVQLLGPSIQMLRGELGDGSAIQKGRIVQLSLLFTGLSGFLAYVVCEQEQSFRMVAQGFRALLL